MRRTARAAAKVAEREFVERATSRAFVISNAVLLIVLVGALAIPTLFDDDGVRRLGYVPQAEQTARLAQERAAQLDTDVQLVAVDDDAVARAAVRPPDQREAPPAGVPDEPVDAALVGGDQVVVWQDLPSDLEQLLTAATRATTVQSVVADLDLSSAQRQALLSPADLDVQPVDPEQQPARRTALFIGFAAVTVLYGLLIFYGQAIAQGIVEEKTSRVVEVLLSAVRPTALVYGKIVGLTALGLAQTVALAAVGVATATWLLDVTIPAAAYGTVALTVGWFVVGFLLYAALFAVVASLVSRQEDLQSAMFPAFIPIFIGFFAAQYALQNPRSLVSLVGGLVPFTAPLVQPLRYGAQVVSPWEVPVALGLCIATVAVLVPFAARLYSGSALRFGGRVRLRDAWRAARS